MGTRHLYWIFNGPSFAVWEVNISEDARHWIGLLQYNPSTVVTVVGLVDVLCQVANVTHYRPDRYVRQGLPFLVRLSSSVLADQKLDILSKKLASPLRLSGSRQASLHTSTIIKGDMTIPLLLRISRIRFSLY